MEKLIAQAEETQTLSQEELVQLLAAEETAAEKLFAAADRVRQQQVGDGVHLRGLMEFSNTCRQNWTPRPQLSLSLVVPMALIKRFSLGQTLCGHFQNLFFHISSFV